MKKNRRPCAHRILSYGELQRCDGKFTGEVHLYNELPLLHLADGAPA